MTGLRAGLPNEQQALGQPRVNHIYQGDCLTVLSRFEAASVDLVFADPPYNISKNNTPGRQRDGRVRHRIREAWDTFEPAAFAAFTTEWIAAAYRVLRPGGSIYVSGVTTCLLEILTGLRQAGFTTKNIVTWWKPNHAPNPFGRIYTYASEFVVFAVKGKNWTFNAKALRDLNPERQQDGSPKMMRDVWVIPATSGTERVKREDGRAAHPAQKPEELLRRVIVASSHANDLVLDPFLGSGTTAVVAEALDRHWIGIEREESYIAVAQARLRAARKTRGLTASSATIAGDLDRADRRINTDGAVSSRKTRSR